MNQNDLDMLLEWLGPDREKAAEKYEAIRARLIRSYRCGGCGNQAEDLADRTIDRVIRKLEKGEVPAPYVGEKAHYFLGCAPYIRQEYFREHSRERDHEVIIIDNDIDAEAKNACLDECLTKIDADDGWLAVEYYRFEKAAKKEHRIRLAREFSLSLAGLRTRVFRIRELLRPCLEECLRRQPAS